MSEAFSNKLAEIVAEWAAAKDRVWEVYLFGSRARHCHVEASDADLAILLLGDNPGETFAYFMFECGGWENELQALLPVKVDLQYADRDSDLVVWPAVQEHGILIYRKAGYLSAL